MGNTLTVLVVDDEQDLRTIARVTLRHLGGFTVVEAASGAEALDVAARLQPDLVLLDVMMPAMDGRDVFTALRANPSTSTIPVVFLTAKAMPDELERLRAMGARAIVTKPFEPAALVDAVRRVFDVPAITDPERDAASPPSPRSEARATDIDQDALRNLLGLPGESQADVMGELIDLFATHTPEAIGSLRAGAAAGVLREAERVAHSLKGSALTLGATGIADLARTIERLAAEGRSADIPPLVDRIDAVFGSTLERLREERVRLLGSLDSSP